MRRSVDVKRFVVPVFVAMALLSVTARPGAAQTDALKFFKNYFVTGDYVVAGVGLHDQGVNGTATGQICIGEKDSNGNCTATGTVPANAEVVAAFLYWQSITKDDGLKGRLGVTFNGVPLTSVDPVSSTQGPLGKQLAVATPPCWSGGGGTGSSGGAWKTYTYRADVLRFLGWDETTGKLMVNGAHQVQLPDGGDVSALGASLVVVYSDPAKPFSAIVLYDGNYAMAQGTDSMFQTLKWFYDGQPSAKMTHIVGSGQGKKSEILYFNGVKIATNPFISAEGIYWDNPTFTLDASKFPSPPPDPLAQVSTSVDHAGFNTFDCLSWAAIVYATPAKDTDADGLLDAWEAPRGGAAYPGTDPYGQPLPNLAAMGADPYCKDVFLELNYMDAVNDANGNPPTYGGVPKPAHSHRPTHESIKLMGDAFWNAPVANPSQCTRSGGAGLGKGIRLHVDLGNAYPLGSTSDPSQNAESYIIRNDPANPCNPTTGQGCLARGGEWIDEAATTRDPLNPDVKCVRKDTDPPEACQFSDYPGTVGWKIGFRYFRDELISATPPALLTSGEDPCDMVYDPLSGLPPLSAGPGGVCEKRFDRVRKNMFRYALLAHAIGLPKSDVPSDPLFHVPQTISGVGDLPGADMLITLGAFSDHIKVPVDNANPPTLVALPTGTPFMVASTLFHEMGHGFGLGHGGPLEDPNCKSVYTSAMNYLYQLRGLVDDQGKLNLNFSLGSNPSVDEGNLADNIFPAVSLSYRIGWYAPLAGSYRATQVPAPIPAASRCPGTPKDPSEAFVRFDAPSTTSKIDWNANGTTETGYSLDANFDGRTTPPPSGQGSLGQLLDDYDDWSNIRLNQLASRRSSGALFRLYPPPADCADTPCLVLGPLSLDANNNDYPTSDYAQYDYGRSYYGRSYYGRSYYGVDLSRGDLGIGDYGRSYYGRSYYGRSYYGRSYYGRSYYGQPYNDQPFTGSADRGRSYLGGGDLSLGDPNNPGGELDHETATWNTPPSQFSSCVIGVPGGCSGNTGDAFKVRSDWTDPNEGGVAKYQVYRVQAQSLQPGQTWELLAEKTPADALVDCSTVGRYDPQNLSKRCYSVITDAALVKDKPYNYFGVAVYDDLISSDPSDRALLWGPNHPPVANAQNLTTAEDTPKPITLMGSDADGDTLTYAVTRSPAHGVLAVNGPNVIYTPAENYNGSDSFEFTANDGSATSTPATVNITVTPVNDTPVANGQANVTVIEDTPTAITLTGSDVESSALTFAVTTLPLHGTLSGAAPNLTYAPATNYNGPDSFAFTVNDGQLTSAPATVSITVTAVNDAPVAGNDAYSTLSGTVLSVGAPGVLGNDTDVEGDQLSAVLVSGPSSGTLALDANGSFKFTPATNYSGTVTFTYQAKESKTGGLSSNVATVTITVKAYSLVGIQNVPPAATKIKVKAGSSVPMKWQFQDGNVVVDSSGVHYTVTIVGPENHTYNDSGNSNFRYDPLTKSWYFNLQTKDPVNGTPWKISPPDYTITITPTTAGYLPSQPFTMTLTK